MAKVCTDRLYPEGELLEDMVDEVDRVRLSMLGVDIQGVDAGGVVNSRKLEVPDRLPGLASKGQDIHIDLDMMPRNLLLVALGVDSSRPFGSWKPAQTKIRHLID